jgi:hypothetical protein
MRQRILIRPTLGMSRAKRIDSMSWLGSVFYFRESLIFRFLAKDAIN